MPEKPAPDPPSIAHDDERAVIAFTIGDINGIGAEVLLKALARPDVLKRCTPVVVANPRLLCEYLAAVPVPQARCNGAELFVDEYPERVVAVGSDAELKWGMVDAESGRLAGDAIAVATRMACAGEVEAVVTMPISKAALQLGGYDFPGHTEMIASIAGGTPMMILMTPGLRVALATIHVPLARVSEMITPALVEQRSRQLARTLLDDFRTTSPRIAVLGLNPHAGEEGLIGNEERDVIVPVLERLRGEGLDVAGPFPADGFFARFKPGAYDAVLAMYHDQGLIPLKFFARGHGVNFTASLPIVRTSPDHGVAFDIAGAGVADESSVVEAVEVAVEVARNRSLIGRRAGSFPGVPGR